MADMPVCSKCARPHWRFVACEDAPAPVAANRRNDDFQVPILPGYHEWKDDLKTHDADGWLIRNPGPKAA